MVFLISRKCPNIELLLDFTRKNMNLLFWERMKIRRSKLNRRPFLIYKNVLVPFGLFFCLEILSKNHFCSDSLVQSFIFLTVSYFRIWERESKKMIKKKKRKLANGFIILDVNTFYLIREVIFRFLFPFILWKK